jgi:hypothetical protein
VGGSGLFTAVLPGTGGRGLELCLKTGGSAGELIRLKETQIAKKKTTNKKIILAAVGFEPTPSK